MTCKIERASDGRATVIRLSGRLRAENLEQIKSEIQDEAAQIGLDLDEVTLVDVEIVRFLNECESAGVELRNCRPYIREWMEQEKR